MELTRAIAGIPASVLAVAPLALDAVAACGGTLARLVMQGARVHYLVAYDCVAFRDRTHRACRILGIAPGDLHLVQLGPAEPRDRARLRMRGYLQRLVAEAQPSLAFLPSLRSADPDDAWVAREAFDALRGRTILSYDRVSRPFNAARPVIVTLDSRQASAKQRAMRPRRLRPGGPAAGNGSPIETFELIEWRPELSPPFEELLAAALPGPLSARPTEDHAQASR